MTTDAAVALTVCGKSVRESNCSWEHEREASERKNSSGKEMRELGVRCSQILSLPSLTPPSFCLLSSLISVDSSTHSPLLHPSSTNCVPPLREISRDRLKSRIRECIAGGDLSWHLSHQNHSVGWVTATEQQRDRVQSLSLRIRDESSCKLQSASVTAMFHQAISCLFHVHFVYAMIELHFLSRLFHSGFYLHIHTNSSTLIQFHTDY